MVVPLLLAAPLAGCAAPDNAPPGPTFAFTERRVDLSGDGDFDAIQVTLLAAGEAIGAARITVRLDGDELPWESVSDGPSWRLGESIIVPCAPGSHHLEVLIDGRSRTEVMTECGVRGSSAPPSFQARIMDTDQDGGHDAIELTVLDGSVPSPQDLSARIGARHVRIYEDPGLTRVLRTTLGPGDRAFVPCIPGEPDLTLAVGGRVLPTLVVSGCEVFVAGTDLHAHWTRLDVDVDGRVDGLLMELMELGDGPFPLAGLNATWNGTRSPVNGSIVLDPPPSTLGANASLVFVCPGEGTYVFRFTVLGLPAFQDAIACQDPPGSPLIELGLKRSMDGLAARLTYSRLGALHLDSLSSPTMDLDLQGVWQGNGTQRFPCPNGTLVLHYEGRLAFRGAAPC